MNRTDLERRLALISRDVEPDERDEIERLERAHHELTVLVMRTAPLNPIALGYRWGETLTHAAAPGIDASCREEGMVVVAGERMTITAATRLVAAAAGRGVALADWHGSAGRMGDLAGMEHPPRAPGRPESASTERKSRDGARPAMDDLFAGL